MLKSLGIWWNLLVSKQILVAELHFYWGLAIFQKKIMKRLHIHFREVMLQLWKINT